MDFEQKRTRVLVIGALVGAVLGAGAAYLLMAAPSGLEEGEEPEPIDARDILAFTGSAAILIRKLDNFRRKL